MTDRKVGKDSAAQQVNLRDENKPGNLTIRKTNRCMRRNEIEQSAIIYQKKES